MKDIIQLPSSAVATTGRPEWQIARKYTDGAAQFERAKLWCQVMAGFELIALHEKYGVKQGQRNDLKGNFPNDSGSWNDTVRQELGISDDTARNWMNMARGAAGRLKALPEFRDLRLLEQPIIELPEASVSTLEKGVQKLCDGKAQKDFLAELGLLKPVVQNAGQPPANECLQEWLEKVHPELAGTRWGALERAVQKEFAKAVAKGEARRTRTDAVTRSDADVQGAQETWQRITGDVETFTPHLTLLSDAELERILDVLVAANQTIRDLQKARRRN